MNKVVKKLSRGELLIFFIGTIGFIITALLMVNDKLTAFDFGIQESILLLRNDSLTTFFVPFSYSGNWQVIVPICFTLLLIKKTRTGYGVPLTIASLTSVVFYQVLKYSFARVRPDESFHLLMQDGYGFPSGHSLTSFLVFGMLVLLLIYYNKSAGAALPMYKKINDTVPYIKSELCLCIICICLFTYIALIGFSRIYVGVHWPSDVLGSWFLGMSLLVVLKRIIWK